ncbi:hypothetical protein FRB93_010869 [Tulasnella sp. JGI-2019a]|nr:hypothetical protein FRB93_010869 [Tulasnella sp. JGI-2019a]
MRGRPGHAHSQSQSQSGTVNQRAQLANAYQELGKELSSERIKVVGNYTLGKVIGEGAYGKVRIGTHRLTSTRVAIKQIPKAMSASLTREIHHHRRLHHPNVTQLYEVIATENNIWLITELCAGGELYDYLVEKGRLSESETRQIFGELCLALNYVHKLGVVHRDLKLENVLLDERCHVKLSDFGFTREFEQGKLLDTFCGTTGYAAPEMLLCQKYTGSEVDIWSLGIILYTLLVGTLPFDDDDEDAMRRKIVQGEYEEPEWLSPDARNLIKKLLQKDPSSRPSVPHILGHPWFVQLQLPEPDAEPLPPPDPLTIDLTEDDPKADPASVPKVSFPTAFPRTPPRASPMELGPLDIPELAPSPIAGHPRESTPQPHSSPSIQLSPGSKPSTSSVTSDATFHSAISCLSYSDEGTNDLPATPADSSEGHNDFARTAESIGDSADGHERSSQSTATGAQSGRTGFTIHQMESQTTLRKQASDKFSPIGSSSHDHNAGIPTVPEEEGFEDAVQSEEPKAFERRTPSARGSSSSLPHSTFPSRTPVRTKRRSVSSNLTNSPPLSPSFSPPPIVPLGSTRSDFLLESHATMPLAFSTDLERNLLNNLSMMGLDTAQVVHSVLTDACDAASALWWMLKRKAERREVVEMRKELERAKAAEALEDPKKGRDRAGSVNKSGLVKVKSREKDRVRERERDKQRDPEKESNDTMDEDEPEPENGNRSKKPVSSITPTLESVVSKAPLIDTTSDMFLTAKNGRPPVALMLKQETRKDIPSHLGSTPSAPDVTFIPPTPVTLTHETKSVDSAPRTPPAQTSSSLNLNVQQLPRVSAPSSPELDRKDTSGKRKQRTGSVSILQRATTALSAAGLSRKKSSDAVKDDVLPSAGSSAGSLPKGDFMESNRPAPEGSASQMTHKLVKSPPVPRENLRPISSTVDVSTAPSALTPGSPYAFPSAPVQTPPLKQSSRLGGPSFVAPTPTNSPMGSYTKGSTASMSTVKIRNRASILTTFKTWFNEDKRKRKAQPALPSIPAGIQASHPAAQIPSPTYGRGTLTSHPSGSLRELGHRNSTSSNRPKRPSVSSRRSSTGSRRSSINSAIYSPQALPPIKTHLLRQRSDASRKSGTRGTMTPTSERGDYSSRPSSVRSFSMTPMTPATRRKRHSKGSSTSSAGSANLGRRGASPGHYHRPGGSTSSTRVLRQVKIAHGGPGHIRSDSQASSRSRASSRPASFHEGSETEASGGGGGGSSGNFTRTESPMRVSRHSSEEGRPQYTTVMVAHRKQSPFGPPSVGRSSWKKSWGHEPPGWSSRSLQSPPELAVDPSRTSIRDVFSGRPSVAFTCAGDDSDWVDEDDDEPSFQGGLGQTNSSSAGPSSQNHRGNTLFAPANLSGPLPGSPNIKAMELPGSRHWGGSSGKRNTRALNHKVAPDVGRHDWSTTASVPEEPASEAVAAVTAVHVDNLGARTRRQPAGRPGPAFKTAIQEEDEGEEE